MISEAFAPTNALALWGVGAVLLGLLTLGWFLQRSRGAAAAWTLALLGLCAVQWLTRDQPAGYRMLGLCGAMLYGMKAVVGAASVRSGQGPLDFPRWLIFASLWMGMRPRAFLGLGSEPKPGVAQIAKLGARNIAAGLALYAAARWAAAGGHDLLALLLGLPALSLLVHFGLFHLQTAAFRARGADVSVLFRNPPLSKSLSEFWGRRWNLAFSEMTALGVHRPLRERIGHGPAVTVAFLFSGLLHELAISAPVQAGWGRPMAYFGLHAIAMRLERQFDLEGWQARVWTIAWVLLPLPLLFHGPFLRGVVGPLIGIG